MSLAERLNARRLPVFDRFDIYIYFYFVLVLICVINIYGRKTGQEHVNDPIILWWTPFTGEIGSWRYCGEYSCFFTENRTYHSHSKTRVMLFYGSNVSPVDLPLPRRSDQEWGLLHEESPKNNPMFCHEPMITLFNYTATWSRHSHFPLTLQHLRRLEDLTDVTYFLSTTTKNELKVRSGLSSIVYIQSSCESPSERDSYVEELMKFVKIDSYGNCLNNKQLPAHLQNPAESMNDKEFWKLMAQYKFTIAFENAIGEDYITEKLWRPLIVGSVPIYMGSPSVKDWLPNEESAILKWNFSSPKELAKYLSYLDSNDTAYNQLLEHKTKKKITNKLLINAMKNRIWGDDFEEENFVESFECFVCRQISEKLENEKKQLSSAFRPTNLQHFNCTFPINPVTNSENANNWWLQHWRQTFIEAQVLQSYVMENRNFSAREFYDSVMKKIS